MQSTKVFMRLWIRWKRPQNSAVLLDPAERKGAQVIECNTGVNYR